MLEGGLVVVAVVLDNRSRVFQLDDSLLGWSLTQSYRGEPDYQWALWMPHSHGSLMTIINEICIISQPRIRIDVHSTVSTWALGSLFFCHYLELMCVINLVMNWLLTNRFFYDLLIFCLHWFASIFWFDWSTCQQSYKLILNVKWWCRT